MMKKLFRIIRTEWMSNVRLAQIKIGDNAPLELNDKPTLIHRDCAMRYYKMSFEELEEFRSAAQNEMISDKEKLKQIADALGDEFYLWSQRVTSYGLEDKMEEIILEIHRSNLTKLQGGEILTNDIGKIEKPESYEPPNLGKFLDN